MHLSQKNASAAFEQLNRCLNDVKDWMSTSKLKLNPDKTEFIIFGSKRQRDKLKACDWPSNLKVKNLGVWFDSDLSLSKHVQNVCKSCFVKLCDFRHVRRFLTHDVSVFVANVNVVISRLDYCNSLFRSLSKFFTQVFLGVLLHLSHPTAVLTVPGAVTMVAISLSFQSAILLFINLSNSLVIVLLLMLLLSGMLF